MQNRRSQWNNQFKKIDSASSLHEKMRKILSTDPYFRFLHCYQEVAVSALVPSYAESLHRIDFYLDELYTVIEIHGNQHYEITNFGGLPYEEAEYNFRKGKLRDSSKKQALLEAGYKYIEISYKDMNNMDAEKLKHIILWS